MATSTIKYRDIKQVTYNKQITWYSTANPYFSATWDVSLSGYKPISVGYSFSGTGTTQIYVFMSVLDGNSYSLGGRMNSNPSSTTQNTVDLFVTYIRN